MKLIKKVIEKDGSGYVKLRPEDDEDMWHIYNLISVGDEVRAPAVRRVQTVSATGSTDSTRVKTNLTIEITKTEYSPSIAPPSTSATPGSGPPDPTSTLHLSGRITRENQHVKMGAFHTLDLEANRDFDLWKKDGWDSVSLGRIDEATVEGRGAEVGAVVCGEGSATICLLTEHMTVVRQRIDVPVPRKRKGVTGVHEKAMERFMQTVYQAIIRHLSFATLKVVVLASPGFTKDALYDYIFAEAVKSSNKPLLQARNKFVRVHTSTSHVHALTEALRGPEISAMLSGTKYAREGMMLDKFHKMLGSDELRAWYGPDHVALAVDRGAVGTLMISDELFRSADTEKRKRFVSLVDEVRTKGGESLIFSSMHESGKQLNQLTGVCAILNFPLDIEVVEQEEREEQERLKEEEKERLHLEAGGA